MKIPKKYFIIILFLVLMPTIGIISAPRARAGDLWSMQEGLGKSDSHEIGTAFGESDPTDVRDVREVAINIILVFLTFVGLICLTVIILGGIIWMSSLGEEEKIRKAKSYIKSAIIGLIIVLASYLITAFITDCALDINLTSTSWMCH